MHATSLSRYLPRRKRRDSGHLCRLQWRRDQPGHGCRRGNPHPGCDATGGDGMSAGPAMAADGASDAPDVVADTSTPDSSPSEIDTGLDAGPPPGDALASLSMCPPLAEPVAELDAAGCGTLKVL